MKVGMYYNNHDVRVEEMSIPEISDNEILLKIMASGICGSDLMEFHRIKKAPCILGHEISGIIQESKHPDYKKGERIFVTHHVPCDSCIECQKGYKTQCNDFKKVNNFTPGGFAEYTKISGKSLETGAIRLESLTYDEGTFIEPLGTVVESAEKLNGDSVLVLGCGIAGLLNIQLARAYGAGTIIATDTNEKRLSYATESGADHALFAKDFTPNYFKELNKGRLADKVIICTGAKSATEMAFKSYEQGGTILFFTTPPEKEEVNIEWYQHWRNGLTTKVTYGATPEANKTAYELLKHKVVKVCNLYTPFPLEKIDQGFRLASKGDVLKAVLHPHKEQ